MTTSERRSNGVLRRVAVATVACATTAAWAAQGTIDLDAYRDTKRYTYAESTHTVGDHTYRFVNIKPTFDTDTTCISSIVIDKRK